MGIALVAGALLVGWIYTLSDRGRTVGRDVLKARRRGRWWMSRAFLARHWPLPVLVAGYTLAFGFLATQLP